MKGIIKLSLAFAIILFGISCGDDEPKTDPIVGIWELNLAEREVSPDGFEYLEYDRERDLFGEDLYTIELKADLTYERVLEGVPLTNGTTDDIVEEGEWKVDDGELRLFSEDDEIGGLTYDFEIAENTGSELTLKFEESGNAFPQAKIDDWFEDGTLASDGTWTVTDDEFDSLDTNFAESIDLTFILEFDKQ